MTFKPGSVKLRNYFYQLVSNKNHQLVICCRLKIRIVEGANNEIWQTSFLLSLPWKNFQTPTKNIYVIPRPWVKIIRMMISFRKLEALHQLNFSTEKVLRKQEELFFLNLLM